MTQFHAVLIGIDAYRAKPLHGCVNDIDAVQRLLLDRAGVPRENIRRLASPHPGAPHETAIQEAPATLANIRSALDALAGRVQEDDRVFLYYSGHGARVSFAHPDGYDVYREALVPADVETASPQRLLYDHDLNEILAGIAARTRAVTCILDCCHSAGVTRGAGLPGATARSLDPVRHLGWRTPPLASAPGRARHEGPARAFGDCHVVAACLEFELAMEEIGEDGVRHGLLTHAFLRALAGIPDPELRTVPWQRIWDAMRAGVKERNPWQHLWMVGNPARAVLAGPPVDADPGLSIRRAGNVYEIDAGTLSSITESALIAVYDDRARLPALGSDEDRAARRGLLRVTSATLSSALAVVEGAPFELQPGARGRLVQPGRAARLRCAVLPPDETIAAAVRESDLLELVAPQQAQVRLEQAGDRWLLTDDLHDETDPLFALGPEDLVHVRRVLDHYYQYALPLRLAESVRDLPGALRLEVLACAHQLSPADAQDPDLPEAPTEGTSAYDLRSGALVCFRVRNTSHKRLRVTMLNSAASGRVQIIGDASPVIDAGGAYVFWAAGELGRPFMMTLPPDKQQGLDRLVVVGTTALSKDLGYLRVEQRFADLLDPPRGATRSSAKDVGGGLASADQWTATQVLIRTRQKLNLRTRS